MDEVLSFAKPEPEPDYTWVKYAVGIIVVLAFIGFNVFTVLGNATDMTASAINPLMQLTGGLIKQTSNVAARGTTGAVQATNAGINSAVDTLEGDIERPKPPPPPPKGESRKHKGGFCYVGEESGFRSCVEVHKADKCMSGNIFPTREICINPELRM
jgi:hypothetical protein